MASILPQGKTVFLDQNGDPLSGGSVTFYVPGTTTLKTTWTSAAETTINPNPVILDSSGSAVIFGRGAYRQVVQDSLANVIWDTVTQDGELDASDRTVTATGGATPKTLAAWMAVLNGNNPASVASVRAHGAAGDGVTDDTAACQSAISAAGVGGEVLWPSGVYFLTATLAKLGQQKWTGAGSNSSVLFRTGDYGDTVSGTADGWIEGLYFKHSGTPYTAGNTVLANPTTSGAHLNLSGPQGVVIHNCNFNRLRYNIRLNAPPQPQPALPTRCRRRLTRLPTPPHHRPARPPPAPAHP